MRVRTRIGPQTKAVRSRVVPQPPVLALRSRFSIGGVACPREWQRVVGIGCRATLT